MSEQMGKKQPVLGAIYVASGRAYVDEAAVSANSLRKAMPGMPIHLHTDLEEAPEVFDTVSKLEDCRYNCYDKAPPLQNSPFAKTIFLDTDTYICGSIDEIDQLLDQYDLLICHTAIRDPFPLEGIPSSFTEFNTGMIAFRSNERVQRFFLEWLRLYDQIDTKNDQPAFRKALWQNTELKWYVLPPEYNFRTIFPGFAGGGSEVKIVHGRHSDWDYVVKRLNHTLDPRVIILSPLERFGNRVVAIRKWSDLFKSWLKSIFSK